MHIILEQTKFKKIWAILANISLFTCTYTIGSWLWWREEKFLEKSNQSLT